MVGVIFRICGQLQKLMIFHVVGMDFTDGKGTFCQCACFIKDYHFSMSESFQIIAAFDQNTDFGRPANTTEETKRNGNDKRTRTGDNQEG